MCCTCKVAFLLIRPIVVFNRSPALPSPLSITRFYILFEQTINIIESFAFSLAKSWYIRLCNRGNKPMATSLRIQGHFFVKKATTGERTTQIWVMPMIGWSKFPPGEKHCPDLGCVKSLVCNSALFRVETSGDVAKYLLFSKTYLNLDAVRI